MTAVIGGALLSLVQVVPGVLKKKDMNHEKKHCQGNKSQSKMKRAKTQQEQNS